MLSFSTCWNGSRHQEGEDLIDEIIDLGFDAIEISHGMKISLLPGIQKAFDRRKIKISGVHNFCPSPVEVLIDAPDVYEFTSHRSYDRERAMKLTFKSLETAANFGSQYLVLHMGSVPMPPLTKSLEELVKKGKLNSKEYVKQKLAFVKKREGLAGLYIERARSALKEIAIKAAEVRVPVAVESRSHFEQVPDEREMQLLMEEFSGNPWVGYWHDFGHVQRKANLFLLNHQQWLAKMKPYLIGGHLHDVEWPHKDHRVPFAGQIDYPPLLANFKPEMPIVWELSSRVRRSHIRKSLTLWKERFEKWC